MTVKGKYKDKKIFLDKKLNLDDNTIVHVNIIPENSLDEFFGIWKNKIRGSSVSYVKKLRKPRYNAD